MKLLTGKDGAHQTFDILEDAEIKISPKQHQNLFDISLFGLLLMACCSYTQIGIKIFIVLE